MRAQQWMGACAAWLVCSGCSLIPLEDLQSGSGGSGGVGRDSGVGAATSISSSSGSAGAGGDAGAGGRADCAGGVLQALRDDFTLPTAQWAPYETGGATIDVMAGLLVATLSDTSADGIGYAGYTSVTSYDVRECSVIVRVVEPMDPAVNGEFYLALSRSSDVTSKLAIGGVIGKVFTTIAQPDTLDTLQGDSGSRAA